MAQVLKDTFMWVERLQVQYFRNYVELDIHFVGGLNLIYGDNGSGKTSLIEAIEYLSSGRTPRGRSDRELIHWNGENLILHCHFRGSQSDEMRIDLLIERSGKQTVKFNQKQHFQLCDWIGRLKTVSFCQQDLQLVAAEPSLRRRFLNMEIGKLHPQYLPTYLQYRRSLAQRNALLKELRMGRASTRLLAQWTQSLLEHGILIIKERRNFISSLAKPALTIHRSLTDERESLQIQYECSCGNNRDMNTNETELRDSFIGALEHRKQDEIRRGTTLVGPHRDDISFLLGLHDSASSNIQWVDLRKFGSQGQHRTAALSAKLGVAELVLQQTGEAPVVLLDDVFSELDQSRRNAILGQLRRFDQLFITTTDRSFVDPQGDIAARVFEVVNGKVHRRN